MNTDQLVNKHYGFGSIMDQVLAGLNLAGKDINSLTVDDLAPIDEFHTRGRTSILEVADLANINKSDIVLDVGCGLGGTARHLAKQYHCNVVGIDLTEEYIEVGNQLTQCVGLDNKVKLQQGSALSLPFGDEEFDVVWTEHVQMNIADKVNFYSEIARVLKPGGKFLFHDIFRGLGDSPLYPAPWAEDESISFLATELEAQNTIENVGLKIDQWNTKVKESIDFFKQIFEKIETEGPPPIGIHLLMGENAKDKLQNYVRNMSENRLSVAMGIAYK
jgi:ubiquinone/menaquinone biosynthesis C-methylase UbiE